MSLVEILVAIIKGVVILSMIGILFYNSIFGIVLLMPLLVAYYINWKKAYEEKNRKRFLMQFQNFLQTLSNGLRTGYSVENAIVECGKELERLYSPDTRIVLELKKMERLLQMNIPIEQVLHQWSKVVGMEEVTNFVEVFTIAKRAGGDSVEIIRKAIQNICEKIETEREIAMVIAAKKLEFQVMVWIPMGILIYMRLSFSQFMEVLYGNVLGVFIMSVCLGIYMIAYAWGQRIVDIEV